MKLKSLALALLCASGVACAAPASPLTDWPRVSSAIVTDAALEARVAQILASMSLAQKIGQMTQAEIKSITPEEVRRYYIGSVLNGGGSWPHGNKQASAAEWTALADAFYTASMATDMTHKVPVIWGIDAIHGNSNVYGATLFPHNIGLGAAHDPALARRIAAATARAVRATGISWVFAPTVAVVRDDRWGRTYEGFSEDPQVVASYAAAYVEGFQGKFQEAGNVVASIKHFMGDGGTDQGKDQGVTSATAAQMLNIHGLGYIHGLRAGAQTVMASYNSWHDRAAGIDYGKMHGSQVLLTGVLKQKMGFDGFVISDWNAIGQLPGCRNDSCALAINAGVDMVMVPDDWKAFIANTMAQVERGEIPLARIDDAVTRILRVKLRAGLFGAKPSDNPYAGKSEALQARALAREAVRASLVLLKNQGQVLPLARTSKVLVVGKSADSLANQTGGWTLTWQGTDNRNSDFANADTILAGIQATLGAAQVSYRAHPSAADLKQADAVIAVIGETPYAEGHGDIGPGASLRHSTRYPEDLAVLKAVAGKGKPVVTVFLSGRPVFVNDLLNLSDAFVAAWLPGSEGGGVADLLFRGADGKPAYDFSGRLSFSWPKSPCQTPLNAGDPGYDPLFALGFGLSVHSQGRLARLPEYADQQTCGSSRALPVFSQADRASFPLAVAAEAGRVVLGDDLNAVIQLPTVKVETAQVNRQQDAKLVTWNGPARIEARAASPRPLPAQVGADAALLLDVVVQAAPRGAVSLHWECGKGCAATLDASALFRRLPLREKRTIKLPLACFAAQGAKTGQVLVPFAVSADAPFAAAFADIAIVGGAARDVDALACKDLQ
ncbi:glycoside hydrolase family 3 protein [Massilia sp. TS11]|uniref:glycoside hydrolase family 3 protein n=1 Tax=Massilia sp. TS11 TaxID=2908003 RepID=UPI001EDC8DC2|nr:glycoside hydrolase family 3 protein [Massilia sp. TS11]MCG2586768.1 exo 1,3/1,4-beta-D-glucan glucohydrolase [Massilia sp. TS11]